MYLLTNEPEAGLLRIWDSDTWMVAVMGFAIAVSMNLAKATSVLQEVVF